MIQLYTRGGAIIIADYPTAGDIQSINPSSFRWQVNTVTGIYTVRDSIINQEYRLGVFSNILDSEGIAYTSDEALQEDLNVFVNKTDVSIQDQTSEIIDLHLSREINEVTLVNNLAIDQRTFDIVSVSLPAIGQLLCLKEGTHFYQGEIITVTPVSGSTYTIKVDSPMDFAYTTAGGCSIRTSQLNVDGSVTPQIFNISPRNTDTRWHIISVKLSVRSSSAMDYSKFAGIAALANGIVLQYKNHTYKNIFNAKTDGDLALHAEIFYADKAPSGEYGMFVLKDFKSRHGAVSQLENETLDELRIIVQDNLSGLLSFEAVAQGHIVTP